VSGASPAGADGGAAVARRNASEPANISPDPSDVTSRKQAGGRSLGLRAAGVDPEHSGLSGDCGGGRVGVMAEPIFHKFRRPSRALNSYRSRSRPRSRI